jgi:predicted nucleic acid-binding protein
VTYLLDINVLLAAVWKEHPQHSKAEQWLAGRSLATCPISELGFLRISTLAKGPFRSDMSTARLLLQGFLDNWRPRFVGHDLPPLHSTPANSDQVTDFYLADVAGKNQMKLATFDRLISHPAVEIIT